MKVVDVFSKGIARSEIGPAPKPTPAPLGQETEIHVHSGNEWIARMQHERNAGRGELRPFSRDLGGEFRGHVAIDVGKVHPGLFK